MTLRSDAARLLVTLSVLAPSACGSEEASGSDGATGGSNATGGATSGGATSGGATSGGATSGGATSGGSAGTSGDGGIGGAGGSGGAGGAGGDAATTPTLKPPCRGLMTRQGAPPASATYVDAFVTHALWSELEPSDQSFTGPGWASIDTAVKGGKAVRLRIMAGIQAPNFVKKLGGPAVSSPGDGIDCAASGGIAVFNPYDKKGGCVPYFWKKGVLDQYEELMQEVAKRYESAPGLREVVDSACMTVYAEPFYRAHADLGSNQRLFAAGLNQATDLACHERAIDIHDAAFPTTRTSLAINTWDIMDPSAPTGRKTSWPLAKAFADGARAQLGGRLVLQNNGLGEAEGCAAGATPDTSYWCYLKSAGGPKGFQTETWERLGGEAGLFAALQNGLAMGANFVELPGGFLAADPVKLTQADQALEATSCCVP